MIRAAGKALPGPCYAREMLRYAVVVCLFAAGLAQADPPSWSGLREVNPPQPSERAVAVVGATLLDGLGGPPVPDSTVVVRGGRIEAVGVRGSVYIPKDAERFDASGLYLLPGMLDAHFHTSRSSRIHGLLKGGFTAFRDPGRPLEAYDEMLAGAEMAPRAFLTGPHFDQTPHAYPGNAVDLRNAAAVESLIDELRGEGASAIKIYFRLPLDLIRVTCERADRHGIPVTAHLELVRADEAIRAGLDGIEHVTSLGTALASPEDARRFEAGVRADNAFRQDGRYWLWSTLDLERDPNVAALLELMLERGVYLTPTLRPFAVSAGDKGVTEEKTGRVREHGALREARPRRGRPDRGFVPRPDSRGGLARARAAR